MKNNLLLLLICAISLYKAQSQNCEWLTQIGGSGYDNFGGIATDPQGNLVVAGTINGNFSMFFSKLNSSGIPVWTKKPRGNAQPLAVAVSDSGYIYLAGQFREWALILDGDTILETNYWDAFVLKLDQNGKLIWARASGGPDPRNGGAWATSLAVNTRGEVFVCGEFHNDTVYFGNVMVKNAYALTPPGQTPSRNMFLVKYTAGGIPEWGRAAGGNYYNSGGVSANALTLDADGNVYVTGGFAPTSLTFDSHTIHLTDSTNRSGDMFLVKYSDKGKALWALHAGGCCGAGASDVAVDTAGNIYVVGESESPSITFGNYTLFNPLGTNTWSGSKFPADFLVKYYPNGQVAWANRFENSYVSEAHGVDVDNKQNVYVTGHAHNASSASNFVLAEYDPNALTLLKKHGSGSNDYGQAIAVDKSGGVFVAGRCGWTSFTFDSCSATPMGDADIFVLKVKEDHTTVVTQAAGEQIAVYPNPSTGLFKIELENLEGEARLRVVDLLGKIIHSSTATKRITEIDLESAAKGIYFLLIDKSDQTSVRKIILR